MAHRERAVISRDRTAPYQRPDPRQAGPTHANKRASTTLQRQHERRAGQPETQGHSVGNDEEEEDLVRPSGMQNFIGVGNMLLGGAKTLLKVAKTLANSQNESDDLDNSGQEGPRSSGDATSSPRSGRDSAAHAVLEVDDKGNTQPALTPNGLAPLPPRRVPQLSPLQVPGSARTSQLGSATTTVSQVLPGAHRFPPVVTPQQSPLTNAATTQQQQQQQGKVGTSTSSSGTHIYNFYYMGNGSAAGNHMVPSTATGVSSQASGPVYGRRSASAMLPGGPRMSNASMIGDMTVLGNGANAPINNNTPVLWRPQVVAGASPFRLTLRSASAAAPGGKRGKLDLDGTSQAFDSQVEATERSTKTRRLDEPQKPSSRASNFNGFTNIGEVSTKAPSQEEPALLMEKKSTTGEAPKPTGPPSTVTQTNPREITAEMKAKTAAFRKPGPAVMIEDDGFASNAGSDDEKEDKKDDKKAADAPKAMSFSFGATAGAPAAAPAAAAKPAGTGGFGFGSDSKTETKPAEDKPKNSSGFTFGSTSTTSAAPEKKAEDKVATSPISDLNPASGFTFGATAAASTSKSAATSAFGFAGAKNDEVKAQEAPPKGPPPKKGGQSVPSGSFSFGSGSTTGPASTVPGLMPPASKPSEEKKETESGSSLMPANGAFPAKNDKPAMSFGTAPTKSAPSPTMNSDPNVSAAGGPFGAAGGKDLGSIVAATPAAKGPSFTVASSSGGLPAPSAAVTSAPAPTAGKTTFGAPSSGLSFAPANSPAAVSSLGEATSGFGGSQGGSGAFNQQQASSKPSANTAAGGGSSFGTGAGKPPPKGGTPSANAFVPVNATKAAGNAGFGGQQANTTGNGGISAPPQGAFGANKQQAPAGTFGSQQQQQQQQPQQFNGANNNPNPPAGNGQQPSSFGGGNQNPNSGKMNLPAVTRKPKITAKSGGNNSTPQGAPPPYNAGGNGGNQQQGGSFGQSVRPQISGGGGPSGGLNQNPGGVQNMNTNNNHGNPNQRNQQAQQGRNQPRAGNFQAPNQGGNGGFQQQQNSNNNNASNPQSGFVGSNQGGFNNNGTNTKQQQNPGGSNSSFGNSGQQGGGGFQKPAGGGNRPQLATTGFGGGSGGGGGFGAAGGPGSPAGAARQQQQQQQQQGGGGSGFGAGMGGMPNNNAFAGQGGQQGQQGGGGKGRRQPKRRY